MELRGCKIRPENGVVDMAAAIELQSRLEAECCRKILLRNALGKLVLGQVQHVDIRLRLSMHCERIQNLMVLLMMDHHDFRRDGRLQGIVVIREVGESVLRSHTANNRGCQTNCAQCHFQGDLISNKLGTFFFLF